MKNNDELILLRFAYNLTCSLIEERTQARHIELLHAGSCDWLRIQILARRCSVIVVDITQFHLNLGFTV